MLNSYERAAEEKREWVLEGLTRELVSNNFIMIFIYTIIDGLQCFSLYWVGLASATGQLIDIPIVTRNFARNIYEPDSTFDLDLLLTLDAGNHPSHPAGTVEKYEADWWTRDEAPIIGDHINFENLPSCLSFHHEVLKDRPEPVTSGIGIGIGIGTGTAGRTNRQLAPWPVIALDCSRCKEYRDAAMDSMYMLHHFCSKVNQQTVTSQEQRLQKMRRSSGFNKLFDAALMKETEAPAMVEPSAIAAPAQLPTPDGLPATEPPTAPGRQLRRRKPAQKVKTDANKPSNGELASIVRHNAAIEFSSRIRHPSVKWTWGIDLEPGDMAELFRGAERNCEVPHSAYDYSLETGHFTGRDSPNPRMPRLDRWRHSSVERVAITELATDDCPNIFDQFPLRRSRSVVLDGRLPIGGKFHFPDVALQIEMMMQVPKRYPTPSPVLSWMEGYRLEVCFIRNIFLMLPCRLK
jgi:hypothetical protein